jgi:hypothetical protein
VRRLLLMSAVATLTFGAAPALAPAGALGQSPPPAPLSLKVDWRLDQAGRDALSLDLLAFGSGSCLPGRVTATVAESAARIRLTVTTPSSGAPCTDDYRATPLTVRLTAPVRGRAIVGPRHLPRAKRLLSPPAADRLRVPRITGLAPADALAVVREHGLRPRVEHVADLRSRARVIGQTPASGHSIRARAVVTLFVSR